MHLPKLTTLLFVVCCFVLTTAMAQGKKIIGKITSEEDGKPLSGVSIFVKGKTIGTQTNASGDFAIEAAAGNILVVSLTGYTTQEIAISTGVSYLVVLSPDATKLSEVVVVGYGTVKRTKLTSSISKLDKKFLESGLRSNPAQALAGTIPGLRVSTGTGRPGSLPSIILRGGTNFDGSGSPLVIMDGQIRSSLSDINPEEIESMEVLKE